MIPHLFTTQLSLRVVRLLLTGRGRTLRLFITLVYIIAGYQQRIRFAVSLCILCMFCWLPPRHQPLAEIWHHFMGQTSSPSDGCIKSRDLHMLDAQAHAKWRPGLSTCSVKYWRKKECCLFHLSNNRADLEKVHKSLWIWVWTSEECCCTLRNVLNDTQW